MPDPVINLKFREVHAEMLRAAGTVIMQLTTIGQRVEVDLFGLQTPGTTGWSGGPVPGTVVDLAPGTITVRLDITLSGRDMITVAKARLQSLG